MDINRILRKTFIREVEHHEELGSTNDRALDLAKRGRGILPVLVIADRQTAGRGRGGNRWWAGRESLTFSLLLDPAAVEDGKEEVALGRQLNHQNALERQVSRPPDDSIKHDFRSNVLFGLAAGVAVAETVQAPLGNMKIGLHWPNDVIAAGRKLAGILVEVLPDGKTVIGIGINTNDSMSDLPAELHPTATTLLDLTGKRQDHTEILVSVLNRLEACINTLKKAPAELASRADAICLQRGKQLALQQGGKIITGVCQGIAPDGALLLKTLEGVCPYYSGTIKR